jgi:general secretion pathway protein G
MQATLERLRARREEQDDEGGFTLIELLIVIVILAILAAIIVFAVQNLSSSSARASCESDVATVDHAVQAFYAQVGTPPANTAALLTGTTGQDGGPVGPWLHSTPTNGNHYEISVNNGAISVLAPGPAFAPPGIVYTTAVGATPTNTPAQACAGVTS